MQVSAFPAIFKADFSRFRCVSACFDRFPACYGRIGRYDPIWPIRPDFGRMGRIVCANLRKKKKKRRRGPTRW